MERREVGSWDIRDASAQTLHRGGGPMKGMVFTEFLEMVEDRFGLSMADRIIGQSGVASGGAYTAVGTYDHVELLSLVASLAEETGLPPSGLYRAFGEYIFSRFATLYPRFVHGSRNSFEFLVQIEDHIHVEVLKIYPDAELPRFLFHRPGPDQLEMEYQSRRGLGDFAEGLIRGCILHFEDSVAIEREDLPDVAGESRVRFRLERRAAGQEGAD